MTESSDSEMSNPVEEPMTEREKEIAKMDRDFTQYTSDANFCVYFKICHGQQDVDDDIKKGCFHPDFVHQIFGISERIFGYKNPIVRFFYAPSSLKRYFKFEYEDKLVKERDGIDADNVLDSLKDVLAEDMEYTQDLELFRKELDSEEEKRFRPHGDMIGTSKLAFKQTKMSCRAELERLSMNGSLDLATTNGKGFPLGPALDKLTNGNHQNGSTNSKPTEDIENLEQKTYHFYHANHETKGIDDIIARMQSFILWFIETALIIDHTDPRWDFFMVYEKYNPNADDKGAELSSEDRYFFCGYATVYRYYVYPDKIRARISQILILPPYRRNGVGSALLENIYNYYKPNKSVLEITVEDPDEDFIAMRDLLDCKNCMSLESFHPDKLKNGWCKEMIIEAREKLKLSRVQARKVYEILKLRTVDSANKDEFTSYRLEIKNRLNVPNQKLKKECDKIIKKGLQLPEALKKHWDNQRLAVAQLDENFQELAKQYEHTLDKLNKIISN